MTQEIQLHSRPGLFRIVRRSTKNTRVAPVEGGDPFLVPTEDLKLSDTPPAQTQINFLPPPPPPLHEPELIPFLPPPPPPEQSAPPETPPGAEVIPYTNLWTKQKSVWFYFPDRKEAPHPRSRWDGVWFVRKIEPQTLPELELSYGDIHNPRNSELLALQDLENLRRLYPQYTDALAVYQGPCIFSDNQSHRLVTLPN
jgi:hypothetical protein